MQATEIGDVIAGKYRIEREIGRGGMGVVFAAMHIDLEQLVAVKVLHEYAAYDQAILSRFLREARAAAKISSDHVVRVMDVGSLPDGGAYIAMELLDGRDLADIVRTDGVLPITAAVDCLIEACDAVSAAHAAGIIHRDLKPANLFLARKANGVESIKVLDFGVSKVLPKAGETVDSASLTQTGQIFGSPNYMSPEQLRNATDVDARTDIWALGVVFYELVSGKLPFVGRTMADVLAAVVRDVPESLSSVCPDIPPALSEVIACCLEKEAERRFANVAALAAALAPFASPEKQSLASRMNREVAPVSVALGKSRGSEAFPTPRGSTPGDKRHTPNLAAVERGAGSGRVTAAELSPKVAASSHRRWLIALIAVGLSFGVITFVATRGPVSRPLVDTNPQIAMSARAPASSADSVVTNVVPSAAPNPSTEPSSIAVAAPAKVRIQLTSNPPNAKVLRGTESLGTTPLTLDVARGSEELRLTLVLKGYQTQEVTVIPNGDRALTVNLLRVSTSGRTQDKPGKSLNGDLEPF